MRKIRKEYDRSQFGLKGTVPIDIKIPKQVLRKLILQSIGKIKSFLDGILSKKCVSKCSREVSVVIESSTKTKIKIG